MATAKKSTASKVTKTLPPKKTGAVKGGIRGNWQNHNLTVVSVRP